MYKYYSLEASMHWENETLFIKSWLHAQHGCHSHKCTKMLKHLPQNLWADIPETWYVTSGTLAHHSLFKR